MATSDLLGHHFDLRLSKVLTRRLLGLQAQPRRVVASSTDSDLEAFSHNPADGSFVALAFHPTTLPII